MPTSRKRDDSAQAVRLRRRAEDAVRAKGIPSLASVAAESVGDLQKIIHELHVHEIELQMQNEELRRTQTELDALRARYFDLYNLAPLGYLVVSLEGMILEANLTAVHLFGTARPALVAQPLSRFIFRDDQDLYYKHRMQLHRTGQPHECELRMVKKDGTTFWVLLTATAARDPSADVDQAPGASTVTRVVLSDITNRKRVEKEKADLEVQLRLVQTPGDPSTNPAAEIDG